ncbi:hypothetical protein ACFVH6_21970 [Spirillospora sp. NPDC127200]
MSTHLANAARAQLAAMLITAEQARNLQATITRAAEAGRAVTTSFSNAARNLGPLPGVRAVDREEREEIAPLFAKLERLSAQRLDEDATLILPEHMLPGVTFLRGLPVIHAAVPRPLIGLPATRTTT